MAEEILLNGQPLKVAQIIDLTESKDVPSHKVEEGYDVSDPFEMKFSRLIRAGKDGKVLRQKGVDVLLSIDMVVKAFRVVKDIAGKKIANCNNPPKNAPPSTSQRLIASLDYKMPLGRSHLTRK